MPMKPKEMIRLLKKNGFIKISQNGSGKQTTVPLHSKDLKKGLEDAILKQAGLK